MIRIHYCRQLVAILAFDKAENRSSATMQFLSRVTELLDETGFPCKKLCFEITETTAISNLAQATAFISELRKRQARYSLDDFGSGHSSFGYLRSMPVDCVKIDSSFVKGMLDDELYGATVRSIVELAKAAGKLLMAEHVETDALAQALTELGVDYGQGYFYGRLDQAVAQGQLACQRDARCYLPQLALAGAHLLRDEPERSADSLIEARRIKPDLSQRQIGVVLGRELAVALHRSARSTN